MDGREELAVLPVLPWSLAALSVVLLVALAVPPGARTDGDLRSGPSPLSRGPVALLAAALALAAAVAARFGPASELANLAPALVVGLGWPVLLLAPPLLGPPARRLLPPPPPGEQDVRPALLPALLVAGALVLPASPTAPRAVATAVAAYALLVVAAGVALGRQAAAARVDALGLVARWGALGPGLLRWAPPRGATAVLAVLLGAAWFERYERTAGWRDALPGRPEVVAGLAAAVGLALLGAALLARACGPAAAAVLLPLAALTAAACVLRRALVSAQVVGARLGDGPAAVDPDPFGVPGGQALALALVTVGAALSAAVLARRSGEGAARLPGTAVLLLLAGASAALVLQP